MDNDQLIFAEEEPDDDVDSENTWKVLIVDDDDEVHNVTHLALNDVIHEGRKIEFISTFTGKEARKAIAKHSDIALILLDVVMEEDDSGLEVVKYIRDELKNSQVRIVLRTGQPGHAPEEKVILQRLQNDLVLQLNS